MKVTKYNLKATVPTGSYANIQPEICIDVTAKDKVEEAHKLAMSHIQGVFNTYSEVPLKERGDVIVTASEMIPSFNEPVDIEYDDINHIYKHEGTELKSVTTLAAEYTEKFDTEKMSGICASRWEMDQDDIKDMWSSNGKAASGFGTAVHEVMEHYFKYKDIGQEVFEKSSKDDNAALPNHPFLRNLIKEFEKIDTVESVGDEHEVLVTNIEKGLCGRVDRLRLLRQNEMSCRIQDYKIVADINKKETLLEPFKELPQTTLSKYQIQLSIYANLLELSGWKVEGLDIYAWDGEWKWYELPILNVVK